MQKMCLNCKFFAQDESYIKEEKADDDVHDR